MNVQLAVDAGKRALGEFDVRTPIGTRNDVLAEGIGTFACLTIGTCLFQHDGKQSLTLVTVLLHILTLGKFQQEVHLLLLFLRESDSAVQRHIQVSEVGSREVS